MRKTVLSTPCRSQRRPDVTALFTGYPVWGRPDDNPGRWTVESDEGNNMALVVGPGGNSFSGQFAWTPILEIAGFGVRGELGGTVLKANFGNKFLAYEYQAFLRVPIIPFFALEGGGAVELTPRVGESLSSKLSGLRIADVQTHEPRLETVILEHFRGRTNTDVSGIGEPATVPTCAAIANAVAHAIGARVRSLPLTPARVLSALKEVPA